jgi:hypothetical protein
MQATNTFSYFSLPRRDLNHQPKCLQFSCIEKLVEKLEYSETTLHLFPTKIKKPVGILNITFVYMDQASPFTQITYISQIFFQDFLNNEKF